MNSFLENLHKTSDQYQSGLITTREAFNWLYFYITNNLKDIPNQLPKELVRIANKHSLGFTEHTFNVELWFRFFDYLLDYRSYSSWDEFERKVDEEFLVIYQKYQKFVVTEPFTANCCIYSMGPYKSNKDVIIETETQLISGSEIYNFNYWAWLKPLNFFEFHRKYIQTEVLDLPIQHSCTIRVDINTLKTKCKIIEGKVTLEEQLLCERGEIDRKN